MLPLISSFIIGLFIMQSCHFINGQIDDDVSSDCDPVEAMKAAAVCQEAVKDSLSVYSIRIIQHMTTLSCCSRFGLNHCLNVAFRASNCTGNEESMVRAVSSIRNVANSIFSNVKDDDCPSHEILGAKIGLCQGLFGFFNAAIRYIKDGDTFPILENMTKSEAEAFLSQPPRESEISALEDYQPEELVNELNHLWERFPEPNGNVAVDENNTVSERGARSLNLTEFDDAWNTFWITYRNNIANATRNYLLSINQTLLFPEFNYTRASIDFMKAYNASLETSREFFANSTRSFLEWVDETNRSINETLTIPEFNFTRASIDFMKAYNASLLTSREVFANNSRNFLEWVNGTSRIPEYNFTRASIDFMEAYNASLLTSREAFANNSRNFLEWVNGTSRIPEFNLTRASIDFMEAYNASLLTSREAFANNSRSFLELINGTRTSINETLPIPEFNLTQASIDFMKAYNASLLTSREFFENSSRSFLEWVNEMSRSSIPGFNASTTDLRMDINNSSHNDALNDSISFRANGSRSLEDNLEEIEFREDMGMLANETEDLSTPVGNSRINGSRNLEALLGRIDNITVEFLNKTKGFWEEISTAWRDKDNSTKRSARCLLNSTLFNEEWVKYLKTIADISESTLATRSDVLNIENVSTTNATRIGSARSLDWNTTDLDTMTCEEMRENFEVLLSLYEDFSELSDKSDDDTDDGSDGQEKSGMRSNSSMSRSLFLDTSNISVFDVSDRMEELLNHTGDFISKIDGVIPDRDPRQLSNGTWSDLIAEFNSTLSNYTSLLTHASTVNDSQLIKFWTAVESRNGSRSLDDDDDDDDDFDDDSDEDLDERVTYRNETVCTEMEERLIESLTNSTNLTSEFQTSDDGRFDSVGATQRPGNFRPSQFRPFVFLAQNNGTSNDTRFEGLETATESFENMFNSNDTLIVTPEIDPRDTDTTEEDIFVSNATAPTIPVFEPRDSGNLTSLSALDQNRSRFLDLGTTPSNSSDNSMELVTTNVTATEDNLKKGRSLNLWNLSTNDSGSRTESGEVDTFFSLDSVLNDTVKLNATTFTRALVNVSEEFGPTLFDVLVDLADLGYNTSDAGNVLSNVIRILEANSTDVPLLHSFMVEANLTNDSTLNGSFMEDMTTPEPNTTPISLEDISTFETTESLASFHHSFMAENSTIQAKTTAPHEHNFIAEVETPWPNMSFETIFETTGTPIAIVDIEDEILVETRSDFSTQESSFEDRRRSMDLNTTYETEKNESTTINDRESRQFFPGRFPGRFPSFTLSPPVTLAQPKVVTTQAPTTTTAARTPAPAPAPTTTTTVIEVKTIESWTDKNFNPKESDLRNAIRILKSLSIATVPNFVLINTLISLVLIRKLL